VGLRQLACGNCGFECRWGHGYLSLVSFVCVAKKRLLRWADHLSRGVLPSVMVVTECIPETSKISRLRFTRSVDPCRQNKG